MCVDISTLIFSGKTSLVQIENGGLKGTDPILAGDLCMLYRNMFLLVYAFVYIYISMYIHTYIHMYVHMYVHIYGYI
jgi:hypothetical protein